MNMTTDREAQAREVLAANMLAKPWGDSGYDATFWFFARITADEAIRAMLAFADTRHPAEVGDYVLVPRDCTDEIAEAIAEEARCCGGIAETIWRKALAAAPTPPLPAQSNDAALDPAKVCDFYLGDCQRCGKRADRYNQLEPCKRPNGRQSTPTAPKPSDVSNDAGGEGRYLADRFEWAAPGDRQEDVWLVRFCDNDVRDMLFTGPDAEREAWEAWEKHAPGYNMYVFRLAALSAPPPVQAGEVELPAVSMHDDQPFVDAWRIMEAKGFAYGDDALENVHLGWQLARVLSTPVSQPTEARIRAEERERCATLALDEKVDAEATGDETDAVYNRAIDDVVAALRQSGADEREATPQ